MSITIEDFFQPVIKPNQTVPLFSETVKAGFPSPASDYVEKTLDLNDLCINRPAATYFVRAAGDSMIDAGIYPGDVMVVDRSLTAKHDSIVIAMLSGEFTVKQLALTPVVRLIPRNSNYQPIELQQGDELEIFGVVTFVVHALS